MKTSDFLTQPKHHTTLAKVPDKSHCKWEATIIILSCINVFADESDFTKSSEFGVLGLSLKLTCVNYRDQDSNSENKSPTDQTEQTNLSVRGKTQT